MDERTLVAELKSGDERAFKTLVLEFQDRIYNTALGILQDQHDAEDISQEVFVEVFHSVKNFKNDSTLTTWLYRIAVNKCLDFLRRKNRKKRFAVITSLFSSGENETAIEIPHFDHPGVRLENKERAATLFLAIENLPEQQRIAFTLHKVEGLSYTEIGEIMNTTLSAVESLMHRAKQNLRKQLQKFYEEEM